MSSMSRDERDLLCIVRTNSVQRSTHANSIIAIDVYNIMFASKDYDVWSILNYSSFRASFDFRNLD